MAYQTLAEKPYLSEYVCHEAVFDCPVAELWPHVLDIGGWMSAHQLETLDGRAGEVGHFERVHPRNLGEETPAPRYHLYGVAEIIPQKLVALEVFPETGGSYGSPVNKTSFDSILLTDLGGRTQLTFLMIDVLLDLSSGDRLHSEDKAERRTRLAGLLDVYFENLRGLVTAARKARGAA
jgi:hypothetical protein